MTKDELLACYDEAAEADEAARAAAAATDKAEYEAKRKKVKAEAEAARRALYTAYARSMTDLPGQLARAGITGGGAETSQMRLRTGYLAGLASNQAGERGALADLDMQTEKLRAAARQASAEARTQLAMKKYNALLDAEKLDAEKLKNETAARNAETAGIKAETARSDAERKKIEAQAKAAAAEAQKMQSQDYVDAAVKLALDNRSATAKLDPVGEIFTGKATASGGSAAGIASEVLAYADEVRAGDTVEDLYARLVFRLGKAKARTYALMLIEARDRGLIRK